MKISPTSANGIGRPDTNILVVNTGSTSVKLALYESTPGPALTIEAPAWSAEIAAADLGRDRVAGIELALRAAPISLVSIDLVGHRIVHGADRFVAPVVIDTEVESAIAEIAEFAPLHNQAGLDGIAAARRVVQPHVRHVAVFDTAFHQSMPAAAYAYGGPHAWLTQGYRRFGFHGISHEWAARRAAELLRRPLVELRLITCHLGGGCSITAVDRGRSVDTTMGFTPLDGLVMATRAGSVDPGLLMHLLRHGSTPDELETILQRDSGLLGLSGVSGDLRNVIAARDDGNERARLAVDVFVHRIASGVGAMMAALDRVDALVFTGGIGQHSAEVRSLVASRFAFIGAQINSDDNRHITGDVDVSAAGARVAILVVKSQEELAIGRAASELALALA